MPAAKPIRSKRPAGSWYAEYSEVLQRRLTPNKKRQKLSELWDAVATLDEQRGSRANEQNAYEMAARILNELGDNPDILLEAVPQDLSALNTMVKERLDQAKAAHVAAETAAAAAPAVPVAAPNEIDQMFAEAKARLDEPGAGGVAAPAAATAQAQAEAARAAAEAARIEAERAAAEATRVRGDSIDAALNANGGYADEVKREVVRTLTGDPTLPVASRDVQNIAENVRYGMIADRLGVRMDNSSDIFSVHPVSGSSENRKIMLSNAIKKAWDYNAQVPALQKILDGKIAQLLRAGKGTEPLPNQTATALLQSAQEEHAENQRRFNVSSKIAEINSPDFSRTHHFQPTDSMKGAMITHLRALPPGSIAPSVPDIFDTVKTEQLKALLTDAQKRGYDLQVKATGGNDSKKKLAAGITYILNHLPNDQNAAVKAKARAILDAAGKNPNEMPASLDAVVTEARKSVQEEQQAKVNAFAASYPPATQALMRQVPGYNDIDVELPPTAQALFAQAQKQALHGLLPAYIHLTLASSREDIITAVLEQEPLSREVPAVQDKARVLLTAAGAGGAALQLDASFTLNKVTQLAHAAYVHDLQERLAPEELEELERSMSASAAHVTGVIQHVKNSLAASDADLRGTPEEIIKRHTTTAVQAVKRELSAAADALAGQYEKAVIDNIKAKIAGFPDDNSRPLPNDLKELAEQARRQEIAKQLKIDGAKAATYATDKDLIEAMKAKFPFLAANANIPAVEAYIASIAENTGKAAQEGAPLLNTLGENILKLQIIAMRGRHVDTLIKKPMAGSPLAKVQAELRTIALDKPLPTTPAEVRQLEINAAQEMYQGIFSTVHVDVQAKIVEHLQTTIPQTAEAAEHFAENVRLQMVAKALNFEALAAKNLTAPAAELREEIRKELMRQLGEDEKSVGQVMQAVDSAGKRSIKIDTVQAAIEAARTAAWNAAFHDEAGELARSTPVRKAKPVVAEAQADVETPARAGSADSDLDSDDGSETSSVAITPLLSPPLTTRVLSGDPVSAPLSTVEASVALRTAYASSGKPMPSKEDIEKIRRALVVIEGLAKEIRSQMKDGKPPMSPELGNRALALLQETYHEITTNPDEYLGRTVNVELKLEDLLKIAREALHRQYVEATNASIQKLADEFKRQKLALLEKIESTQEEADKASGRAFAALGTAGVAWMIPVAGAAITIAAALTAVGCGAICAANASSVREMNEQLAQLEAQLKQDQERVKRIAQLIQDGFAAQYCKNPGYPTPEEQARLDHAYISPKAFTTLIEGEHPILDRSYFESLLASRGITGSAQKEIVALAVQGENKNFFQHHVLGEGRKSPVQILGEAQLLYLDQQLQNAERNTTSLTQPEQQLLQMQRAYLDALRAAPDLNLVAIPKDLKELETRAELCHYMESDPKVVKKADAALALKAAATGELSEADKKIRAEAIARVVMHMPTSTFETASAPGSLIAPAAVIPMSSHELLASSVVTGLKEIGKEMRVKADAATQAMILGHIKKYNYMHEGQCYIHKEGSDGLFEIRVKHDGHIVPKTGPIPATPPTNKLDSQPVIATVNTKTGSIHFQDTSNDKALDIAMEAALLAFGDRIAIHAIPTEPKTLDSLKRVLLQMCKDGKVLTDLPSMVGSRQKALADDLLMHLAVELTKAGKDDAAIMKSLGGSDSPLNKRLEALKAAPANTAKIAEAKAKADAEAAKLADDAKAKADAAAREAAAKAKVDALKGTKPAPADSHYSTLGVPSTATPAEIKAAYHTLALRAHPDKRSNTAGVSMQKLNEAYRVLRDPERRRAYDASIRIAPVLAICDGPQQKAAATAKLAADTEAKAEAEAKAKALHLGERIDSASSIEQRIAKAKERPHFDAPNGDTYSVEGSMTKAYWNKNESEKENCLTSSHIEERLVALYDTIPRESSKWDDVARESYRLVIRWKELSVTGGSTPPLEISDLPTSWNELRARAEESIRLRAAVASTAHPSPGSETGRSPAGAFSAHSRTEMASTPVLERT